MKTYKWPLVIAFIFHFKNVFNLIIQKDWIFIGE